MNARMERSGAAREAAPMRGAEQPGQEAVRADEARLSALRREEELLRDEIRRGKECLDEAKRRLARSRSTLEEWPLYERRCGVDCLPDLTQAITTQKRVERFLKTWLKRREQQLAAVAQEIARHPDQPSLARLSAELTHQAHDTQPAPPFIPPANPAPALARWAA